MIDPSQISILIADDHPLLLKGLGDFLRGRGFQVVKQARDGSEAWRFIIDLKPDFAILDIDMPYMTGLNVADLVYKNELAVNTILLSYQIDRATIKIGQQKGVKGFLLKEDALADIENCIYAIAKNENFISTSLQDKEALIEDIPSLRLDKLSPSEKKIIKKIAEGKSSKEIGELFNISERTVEKHRSNIIKKLLLENGQYALMNWVSGNKDLIYNL
ncbi:response regulator transcription factor [Portibacter lacus]|uniref:DNA-binding response regulator n=1 Tax=Portibacter lacus TaxID=1099794 RepID=A0AA37SKJ8_9BACT|nr:response regulator transcription factor [Portibacter lacus]GLR15580.1 DNA-binding response regulator [Portibacter lacus]